MVQKLSLPDIPSNPHVVGFYHYAAPALSTALFASAWSTWSTVPALLHEGTSNASIAAWAEKHCSMSGNAEIVGLAATIASGLKSALDLPFGSFARFYFIVGSLSTTIYLLFTPFIRAKVNRISEYGLEKNASLYPRKDLKTVLRVHLVSLLFGAAGVASYGYGLYNALNNY